MTEADKHVESVIKNILRYSELSLDEIVGQIQSHPEVAIHEALWRLIDRGEIVLTQDHTFAAREEADE